MLSCPQQILINTRIMPLLCKCRLDRHFRSGRCGWRRQSQPGHLVRGVLICSEQGIAWIVKPDIFQFFRVQSVVTREVRIDIFPHCSSFRCDLEHATEGGLGYESVAIAKPLCGAPRISQDQLQYPCFRSALAVVLRHQGAAKSWQFAGECGRRRTVIVMHGYSNMSNRQNNLIVRISGDEVMLKTYMNGVKKPMGKACIIRH